VRGIVYFFQVIKLIPPGKSKKVWVFYSVALPLAKQFSRADFSGMND
jgi:hypothetical protein